MTRGAAHVTVLLEEAVGALAIKADGTYVDATFGRGGLGIFPAPLALADQVATQLDATPLGAMSGVSEHIYALSNERRIRHPAIEVLCNASPQGTPEPRV